MTLPKGGASTPSSQLPVTSALGDLTHLVALKVVHVHHIHTSGTQTDTQANENNNNKTEVTLPAPITFKE